SVMPEVEPDIAALHVGAADVCVAPYDRSVLLHAGRSEYGAAMKGDPLKIYAYMACARPVVASYFREAGARLEQLQAGMAVPPEDPAALAEALCRLLGSPQQLEQMGQRGRQFVEREAT